MILGIYPFLGLLKKHLWVFTDVISCKHPDGRTELIRFTHPSYTTNHPIWIPKGDWVVGAKDGLNDRLFVVKGSKPIQLLLVCFLKVTGNVLCIQSRGRVK